MSPLHPSTDLRIADLPEDLRDEGTRLRAEYYALLSRGGFLNDDGAVDLGLLQDLERVQSCDLATLRAIAETAEALANLEGPVRREYEELQAPFRRDCPIEEYCSADFTEEAASNGFSRFQWAQVQMVCRQAALSTSVFTPDGLRKLKVEGFLQLQNCEHLTALPAELTVKLSLYLNYCSSLCVLPQKLVVGRDFHIEGCFGLTSLPRDLTIRGGIFLGSSSLSMKEAARVLKINGQIGAIRT